jgi:hypothetical protein
MNPNFKLILDSPRFKYVILLQLYQISPMEFHTEVSKYARLERIQPTVRMGI